MCTNARELMVLRFECVYDKKQTQSEVTKFQAKSIFEDENT